MDGTRRQIIQGASAAVLASALRAKGQPESPDWYRRGIIIGGLGRVSDPYATENQLRLSDRAWGEIQASGVTAVNQTIQPAGNYPNAWAEHLEQLEWIDRVVAANPDRLRRVGSIADIITAKKSSQVGIIYGTQDTAMVGTPLDRLAEMKKRGIRIVQLTYNLRNLSGDGALEPANAGLSKLGVATIERVESERLLLDLSHGGAQTIREAIALAKRPLTISHTGCRNVHDHPRNVWDSELKAVADKGGVAGIYFMAFLAPTSRATSADLIAHIEHALNVCGEDHIGIGTDGHSQIEAEAAHGGRNDSVQRLPCAADEGAETGVLEPCAAAWV